MWLIKVESSWMSIFQKKDSSSLPIISPVLDVPTIIIDEIKQSYCQFQAKKQGLPTTQKKLSDKYPHSAIDWEKVYSLSFRSSMKSKLREFQYKVLNCIVFTKWKTLSFWYYAITTMYFLPKRGQIHQASTLFL